ncbi:hypothetical protein X738_28770 [Mesorhizobium sp. LNHC209A00]|nr:hypothetical protein X738_28770 [Mesorhizobium sp. LNHC209A00]
MPEKESLIKQRLADLLSCRKSDIKWDAHGRAHMHVDIAFSE